MSSSVCKSEELYQLAGDLLQQELRASGGVLSLRLMGKGICSSSVQYIGPAGCRDNMSSDC